MREPAKQSAIVCCPLCGENLSGYATEELNTCPACGFNLLLVKRSETPQVPATGPAYVPQFTYWLILIQIVLAVLFAFLFLFFASSYYFGIPIVLAVLHLVSIGILTAFLIALRREMTITGVKVGLLAIGIVTLPIGACAISAALSITLAQRYCSACGKKLRGTSYVECPHCFASMHRLGRCRQNQFHQIASLLDYVPSQSEIEQFCSQCLKIMDQTALRGNEND
ncbi:MAG: hypothetical protein ACFE89_01845 [Candidatus Hodarchaeota archaeon]